MPAVGRYRVIEGYVYATSIPLTRSPEELGRALQLYFETMARAVSALADRWQRDFLPAILRDHGSLSAPLEPLNDGQLLALVDEALETQQRHWTIHMLVMLPVLFAGGVLAQNYAEITGDREEATPYKLLQGFDNKTLETDRALAHLAHEARAHPQVTRVIMARAPRLPRRELLASPAGRLFLSQFQRFLDDYGWRATGPIACNFASPTRRDDPSFVLNTLRSHLLAHRQHRQDPDARHRLLVREREALLSRVYEFIGDDDSKRKHFDRALAEAQAIAPLRETHEYYIDQRTSSLIRRIFQECGSRLNVLDVVGGRRRIGCRGRDQGLECTQPSCYLDVLEDQVAAYLAAFHIPSDYQQRILEMHSKLTDAYSETEKRQAALAERLTRLRDLYEMGDLQRKEYVTRRDPPTG